MKRLDFSCFSGNWPFHKVRYNTVAKIAELHKRCGIEGGLISSCEAIFYQDPYEAEVSLARELEGTGYRQAMVLNPTLPGWKDDLRRAVEQLGIKAIRLVPGYHGYLLTDAVMDEVSGALQQYKLPLIITLRTEDARTAWMLMPRTIPMDEVKAYLEKNPDIPTLIANIRVNEVASLAELFKVRENLFIDTSGFMKGLFPVDDAYPMVKGQMVFGSNAPLSEMQSISFLVDHAAISSAQKEAIYSGEGFLRYIL